MLADDDPPEPWQKAKKEADLFRQDQAAAERWVAFTRQQVDMLVGGLRPSDAWMQLPSFAIVHFWKTKRWGRRPGGY